MEDQRALPDDAHLPREDRGRHELEAHLPHLLAEARHHLVRHRERCFRCHVARGRSGAPGRENESAAHVVHQLLQHCFDHRLIVRNEAFFDPKRRRERLGEPVFEGRQSLVRVLTARGAIADGYEAEQERVVRGHG